MATSPTPSAHLTVKVVSGSSRDQIVGWLGDALKIKVTVTPEEARANETVVSLLTGRLRLPAKPVAVVSGHSSPGESGTHSSPLVYDVSRGHVARGACGNPFAVGRLKKGSQQ